LEVVSIYRISGFKTVVFYENGDATNDTTPVGRPRTNDGRKRSRQTKAEADENTNMAKNGSQVSPNEARYHGSQYEDNQEMLAKMEARQERGQ
jgi:hypothetical protein